MVEGVLLLALLALAYAWAERRRRALLWPRRDRPTGRRPRVVPPGGYPTRPFGATARVVDGDGLEVTSLATGAVIGVRVAGIDAPELDQPEGRAALGALRDLLRSGACEVEPRGPDRYGRLVALVRAPGGGDVGLAMIAAGFAIALHPCPDAYRHAERRARAGRQGAWGRQGFMRPSRWRHRARRA